MSDQDRPDDREREIDDLLKGGGGQTGGRRPDSGGELEDLLTDPAGGSGRRPKQREGSRPAPVGSRRRSERDSVGEDPRGPSAVLQPDPRDKVKLRFNYGILVGILIAFLAIFILFNTLRNTESGTVGIGPVGIGEKVDPFAVPIAVSDLEGDANVDPEEACRVAGEDVLRICDYLDRPLLISFWFTGGAAECIDQQDVFEQVAERFRSRIGAVSINVRDDRDKVRDLVEERGWQVPVGHDTDGAVSNMYRVGGCPTFLFVRQGGVLEKAEIGRTTVEELGSQVRSFLDGQEAKEETPGQGTTG